MAGPKVQGLNHLTLAVTDLERSVAFYRDILGFDLRALWEDGAYLEAGPLWLCLSVDPAAASAVRADYTHYAFGVAAEDFEALSERVRARAPEWKDNRSEGASLYFLDPDGHRLELHVGDLQSRGPLPSPPSTLTPATAARVLRRWGSPRSTRPG